MEPIVIFTRARLCDKPVLRSAKNGSKFYVFTIQSNESKYPCRLFEDAECFDKMESLHLENGDYLDLNCTMKKMVQKVKMTAVTEDGENVEVEMPHEIIVFKVKNLDFAIPYEASTSKKEHQKQKNQSKGVKPMTDLSAFEE